MENTQELCKSSLQCLIYTNCISPDRFQQAIHGILELHTAIYTGCEYSTNNILCVFPFPCFPECSILHSWLSSINRLYMLACSSNSTLLDPLRTRLYAVELPSTPAPTTTTSYCSSMPTHAAYRGYPAPLVILYDFTRRPAQRPLSAELRCLRSILNTSNINEVACILDTNKTNFCIGRSKRSVNHNPCLHEGIALLGILTAMPRFPDSDAAFLLSSNAAVSL